MQLRLRYNLAETVFLALFFFFFSPLTCELMQAHPWFVDVDWDKLYDMEAAFKPEVNGELDTRNFMKFDEVQTDPFALLCFLCLLFSLGLFYFIFDFYETNCNGYFRGGDPFFML